MALKKLSLDIYEKYRDTIDRYMELVSCEQKEKVNTATVQIMYAIQDINRQIEKYNSGKLDIAIYYQLMIKTDFLISILEVLYKIFISTEKRDTIWTDDYDKILKFRLYRSLTLAHPLETTRYEKFGYGKANEKWCEDIHVKGEVEAICFSEIKEADFIMEVMEKGNSFSTKIPICVQQDILPIVKIVLKHLKIFTDKIYLNLKAAIQKLKNTPLNVDKAMNITDYIYMVLEEVKKRYPSTIENIVYEDNTEEQHHILLEALERLEYSFKDTEREKKYNVYKEEIQQAVYNYAESVQNMTLEDDKSDKRLQQLLHPDSSILSDKSEEEQAHYKYEKIVMYLSDSDKRSVANAKRKLEQLSYDGCRGVGVCTNAEWGVIQLLIVQKDFLPYFPIDFDATDKELYFQFCTAVYYANKSTN